jgi:hypothetical protein
MKYYFGGANTSEASDAAVNGRTWTYENVVPFKGNARVVCATPK